MDYTQRCLLVVGGAGFIGSHIVDALAKENPSAIHVVDNLFLGREENIAEARETFGRVVFHRMDATDGRALRGLIRKEKIEIVFNLATKALGHSFHDPLDTFHVNVQIAGHLLESLRAGEVGRLVHFSSSEVYGTAREVPMLESHPLLPHTPYAAGKAAADLMVRSYQETFRVQVLVIRPFNNYGPRQNRGLYAGVVPITMTRILRGEPPIICGDGTQTRDFIFVRDTARLTVLLAKRDDVYGRVLNLGTGREVSVNDLIRTICSITGYKGSITQAPPRPGDVQRQCADVTSVKHLLGHLSLCSLEQGLAETWQWYASKPKALAK